MSQFIAALPMYDWPEARAEVDAQWRRIRNALRAQGIDAPEELTRRNGDLPPVPGGIVGPGGDIIAPDPASLPPDELHLPALWRHPAMVFGQTCWGPMDLGLAAHVRVIGQPDYSGFRGGAGPLYSSAILTRQAGPDVEPPHDGAPSLPFEKMRGARFAFNSNDSMSGMMGLSRDLEAAGEGISLFSELVETGAHRASIVAVAEGRADICAIDCRSLGMARRFERATGELSVIGWTGRRPGLPYIAALGAPAISMERGSIRSFANVAGIVG